MDNLHRELAPISGVAWADLEEEARRTFRRHVAGRRIVDVDGPGRARAVGGRHRAPAAIDQDSDGVMAHTRRAQPIVELRVPFTVDRQQVDDVERGAKDADWQPVKDAARQLAFAEDRAIFDGYPAAGITGIRASSSPTRRSHSRPRYATTRRHQPGRHARCDWPGSTARTRWRSAPTPTPQSVRPPTRATRSTGTSPASWTVRSSGHPPSTAPSWCPPAAATSSCTSARMSPSATSPTTPPASQLYFQETLTFLVNTTEAAVTLSAPPDA